MFDKNPVEPRANVSSRNYRTMTYQETDRVPDIEFNYWGQTLQRWVGEGMDVGVGYEDPEFYQKVMDYFGYDTDFNHHHLGVRTEMNPYFEEAELERRERSVICRSATGVVAEHFNESSGAMSIPHYLEFPVKTPADWADMKRRFDPDDPCRTRPAEEIDALRTAIADGKMIFLFLNGPYGALREWMGFENLSCAFFEYPDMVHDMAQTWTDLLVSQIETIPEDLFVDEVMIWEDMACRNGPFVGPDMFRDFLQPCYHAFMTALKKRGCALGIVDCDGDPHDIVANWLEEGVNVMFPLEIAAGVDIYAWREEFGKELRLWGGVDKRALIEGGSAIDVELDRLKPMLEQGGFIPHLDHLVPPDISLANYQYYLEKKRKMIGKI